MKKILFLFTFIITLKADECALLLANEDNLSSGFNKMLFEAATNAQNLCKIKLRLKSFTALQMKFVAQTALVRAFIIFQIYKILKSALLLSPLSVKNSKIFQISKPCRIILSTGRIKVWGISRFIRTFGASTIRL